MRPSLRRLACVVSFVAILRTASAQMDASSKVSKADMPDLMASANACMPTSTTNLIYWFAKHGFPALMPSDAYGDDTERQQALKSCMLQVAGGNFDNGTSALTFSKQLADYVKSKGYQCRVVPLIFTHMPLELSQSLLEQNARADVGYILLTVGGDYLYQGNQFRMDPRLGHAITLVDYRDTAVIVDDPAHYASQSGRVSLSMVPLKSATLYNTDTRDVKPVDGCYLLKGGQVLDGHDILLWGVVQVVISNLPVPENPTQYPGDASTVAAPAAPTPTPHKHALVAF